MRIVHIITRLILGGAQENTLLTVEDLARDYGDEVTLVTGPALGPEGSLLERAYRNRVDVRLVPSLRRAVNPWRDWRSYRALVRLLRELQPAVVHTHSSKAGVLGRAAAAKLHVPLVVHTVHGMAFHPYQARLANWLFRKAERRAARHTHAYISVADAMSEAMVAGGVAPRERFTTIYSGMEVEPFLEPLRPREEVRRELGYRDEHVVVGKVARLFELKGHDDVIDAAREVVRRHRQARFLFVGDGVWRERLARRIADEGLAEHFQFTGLVPPERVPELLGAMDMVVHASLREGLARVLPQALIAGRPVVSYDVDGAREVVIEGETGFLVRPRDVAGLASRLCVLAGDAELRARLGAAGRERFTERFRHETMTGAIRELYCRLLEGRVAVKDAAAALAGGLTKDEARMTKGMTQLQ